jgi:hypothetical protein
MSYQAKELRKKRPLLPVHQVIAESIDAAVFDAYDSLTLAQHALLARNGIGHKEFGSLYEASKGGIVEHLEAIEKGLVTDEASKPKADLRSFPVFRPNNRYDPALVARSYVAILDGTADDERTPGVRVLKRAFDLNQENIYSELPSTAYRSAMITFSELDKR